MSKGPINICDACVHRELEHSGGFGGDYSSHNVCKKAKKTIPHGGSQKVLTPTWCPYLKK